MDDACGDIQANACQTDSRLAVLFFPRCSAREALCDVDESLSPLRCHIDCEKLY